MNIIKKTYCLLLVLLYSTILQAQDSRWNVNIYDYQYDMSVYAELQYNGSAITDFTNIEVAAFVDNECRAIGVPQQKDGVSWIYFRVRSNTVAGESVGFKMYNKTEDKEYFLSAEENIEFEANRSLGLPSSPVTLLKAVVYSVSASSANESMGFASVENYIGEAPVNSDVIVKATPSVGHTFVEWKKNGQTVSSDNPYTFKITEDTHLLAHFKTNQYTITFDTDGGSDIAPITQDYNTTITAPTNPIKTGYTFAGWDSEIPATMPAEDITIKALWTINKYKLTYQVDGEVYRQYDVDYNSVITPEAAPEKEGYVFSGWSEIPEIMPAHDVVIVGTFSKNFIPGDANNSGEVNVSDITAVVSYIYGQTPEKFNFAAADVNNSGEINVSDITGIVSIIYGNSVNGSKSTSMSDVEGARMNSDAKLPKGVYIVNGKKQVGR